MDRALSLVSRFLKSGLILSALCCGLAACGASAGEAPAYDLRFEARLLPENASAEVRIIVSQSRSILKTLDFNAPANRFTNATGPGVSAAEGRIRWRVPAAGGELRYLATVNSLRGSVHDARLTESWGVLRLDDLFPPAKARAVAGTVAEATLRLSGPEGWRFETPYGPSNQPVHSITGVRIFPRPVGWMAAGEIGVRRDRIANRRVAVAAPVGENFRRQDTLAFLRWTLPELISVFPRFSERLLIVGSGRDMWRGGLSGPGSLYLHPERPLISGNATSTLLHELVHVAMGATPGGREDWLIEGLAEYYSLEVLRRTGGISERRFEDALARLADWSRREGGHLAEPSKGANTAQAVLVLNELATNLSAQGYRLDALIARLGRGGAFTGAALDGALDEIDYSGPRPWQERSPL
ncbi:MAG: hypothetical protein AAGE43_05950 [Pseudomonadota bacterium]